MAEAQQLEFMTDDSLAGFRLHRFEVFNWGTFNGKVWTLRLDGKNTLLAGEIASGKSTLVDAITTLLVPGQRVVYNKAAGAEGRERTLKSYILGHYKSVRQESLDSTRRVGLREPGAYSVILGVFRNAGYGKTVTLAQVFWIKDSAAPPARFYAISEQDLSISADFSEFGSEMSALRRRLKEQGVELFDSFSAYGARFRPLLGIRNEQALDLFNQTVSLKAIGNLTSFVREHMLAPFAVSDRIADMIQHFENLNSAHESILKAKRQIAMLEPLVEGVNRHQEQMQRTGELRACREALPAWFATRKKELLDQRIAELDSELVTCQSAIEQLEEQRQNQQEEERELRRTIAASGGERLESLAREIRQQAKERDERRKKADRYAVLLANLGLNAPESAEDFQQQQAELADQGQQAGVEEANVQNEITETEVAFRQGMTAHKALRAEIAGLRARVSNIDENQVSLRRKLCAALRCPEEDMPFVGELLRVREEERDWEGAIERYLHNFGLSLLVPDRHYAKVAAWVDETHLKGRLVYFHVREGRVNSDVPVLRPDALARKVEIKPDSPFADWMAQEMARRGNLACCETQDQFRREAWAITKAGQIKSGGTRHEKDDRHSLGDRRNYVLGWTNEEKIAALEQEARDQESALAEQGSRIGHLQEQQRAIRERLAVFSKLGEYAGFQELDWATAALEVARLEAARQELEASSNQIQTLTSQLQSLLNALKATEQQLEERKDRRSRIGQQRGDALRLRDQAQQLRDQADNAGLAFARLEALRQQNAEAPPQSVEDCDRHERAMREQITQRIDAADLESKRLAEEIVARMTEYRNAWPLETKEVDSNVAAGPEYALMLERLQADGLPGFEERFKKLLNENAIREVVGFHAQLEKESRIIRERISQINESLFQIDYNKNRYIRLEAQASADADIREFRSELRSCAEGAFTGTDEDLHYSEERFLHVKKLIDRFKGREGLAELDRRWTERVTDVRNWFEFAASERKREDDSEFDIYKDSDGKSGGQKEKLAYTVLAASLAYQFGLEWGQVRSRSFRFVVIDEAFGRGSDESTKYGLQLFAKLNLQLLIVTPMQKVGIIENFVGRVGFVHNKDGRNSVLRNLDIEQYQEEKQEFLQK